MVLEKNHEEQIIEAVRKAVESVDYGEVKIRLNKDAPELEVIIDTQKKLRFKKTA